MMFIKFGRNVATQTDVLAVVMNFDELVTLRAGERLAVFIAETNTTYIVQAHPTEDASKYHIERDEPGIEIRQIPGVRY